jgi:hypothetical protein
MPVGKSRRIVIDVDDIALKRRLYSALAADGRSLKEWFVSAVDQFLDARPTDGHPDFLRDSAAATRYGTSLKGRKRE